MFIKDEKKEYEVIEEETIENNAIEEDTSNDEVIHLDDSEPTITNQEPANIDEVEKESNAEPVLEKENIVKRDEVEVESLNDKVSNGTIIADKFQNQQPSVNDMLAGFKKNTDLASRLKDRPISDLKTAIKINDRIWFINELFNKDSNLYETAINEINNFDNLDKALEFLFTNYTWDQNKKSTVSFLELVFRRFANQ